MEYCHQQEHDCCKRGVIAGDVITGDAIACDSIAGGEIAGGEQSKEERLQEERVGGCNRRRSDCQKQVIAGGAIPYNLI